jgi:hypothetical protein
MGLGLGLGLGLYLRRYTRLRVRLCLRLYLRLYLRLRFCVLAARPDRRLGPRPAFNLNLNIGADANVE